MGLTNSAAIFFASRSDIAAEATFNRTSFLVMRPF